MHEEASSRAISSKARQALEVEVDTEPAVAADRRKEPFWVCLGPIQPAWFAEGLATYLETVSYDRSTHQAVLGRPPADHVSWLRGTGVMIRSERLFAASRPDHDDMRETMSFYSSSWLLVHYLLNRESERFGDFQRRLARLEEWHDAWQASFGELSSQHLDAQVVAHAEQTEASSLAGPVRLEPY